MRSWECDICGHIHEGEAAPEKCPVCDAPSENFVEVTKKDSETIKGNSAEGGVERKWRCTLCGYVHTGTAPPETCPVCNAGPEMFEEVLEKENEEDPAALVDKRWKCTVCGYIHTGPEPPEKCPVCDAPASMFLELDENGKEIGSLLVAEKEPKDPGEPQASSSLFNALADLLVRHHLHPISVHFPNGILPVVVFFLAIAVFFNTASFEAAAFYNLIVVLLAMPLVLLTGYLEWQKTYKGIKTSVFITKIICGLVVLASVNILVFWRIIDPGVIAEGSPVKWIYLGIAALMLGAAGLAGHLGGKLVFGSRG